MKEFFKMTKSLHVIEKCDYGNYLFHYVYFVFLIYYFPLMKNAANQVIFALNPWEDLIFSKIPASPWYACWFAFSWWPDHLFFRLIATSEILLLIIWFLILSFRLSFRMIHLIVVFPFNSCDILVDILISIL